MTQFQTLSIKEHLAKQTVKVKLPKKTKKSKAFDRPTNRVRKRRTFQFEQQKLRALPFLQFTAFQTYVMFSLFSPFQRKQSLQVSRQSYTSPFKNYTENECAPKNRRVNSLRRSTHRSSKIAIAVLLGLSSNTLK